MDFIYGYRQQRFCLSNEEGRIQQHKKRPQFAASMQNNDVIPPVATGGIEIIDVKGWKTSTCRSKTEKEAFQ